MAPRNRRSPGNLGRSDTLAGLAQPRLESNFFLSARTQLGGGALANGLVGGQFLSWR